MTRDDGVTIAIPRCSPSCPPFVRWPLRSLAMQSCPECGCGGHDPKLIARAIVAVRLLEQDVAAIHEGMGC